jgi:NAD(P)-dependent dehydrogenase (short-subunit alcohol dehydrogenase family)
MPADRSPSVLISGIHSEHGFAISHRLRREGWFVVGCDQGQTTGRNARAHITVDVTDEADCLRAVEYAAELGNGLDCVVTCAHLRVDGPVEEFGGPAWDVLMGVNAKSVFLLARAAVPYLAETHGTIVPVVPGQPGNHEHAVFDASRAAMVSLVGSLETELAPRSIHVSMVTPDDHGRSLSANEVADAVWAQVCRDEEGHIRSFAHAH